MGDLAAVWKCEIITVLKYELVFLAVDASVAEDDGVEVMMLVCCLR